MGFLLIDANMLASLLIPPIVKLEQIELMVALYYSFLNSKPDHCCWLTGNFDLEVLLFENKELQANGLTTVLLTELIQASKSSSNFLVH